MEIRDLKYFCLTAELEHVSRAAEKLGVAQPYLTKIIGGIENELGGNLFDKAGRRIKLNDSGRVFYRHAKDILQSVDHMYAEMEQVFDRKSRIITFLCNTEVYSRDLIVEFQQKNSEYGVRVSYASDKEMMEALRLGEADFVICSPPLDNNSVNGITTEIIFRDVVCVLLPEGHRLLKKGSVTLKDLKYERLITGPKGSAIRNSVDAVCEKYSFEPIVVCETDDLSLIIKAVSGGLGYAFISYATILRFPELRQHCLELNARESHGYFSLSYNKSAVKSPAIADFYSFTKEYFKNLQELMTAEFNLPGC